jgi:hypothetical protein
VVVAESDCILGSISDEIYYEVIHHEKMKIKNKYSTHIVNDLFLRGINLVYFMDNYFHLFSLNNYEQGKTLFYEKEELDFIYYIKEGEVEISFVKDLYEMINTIKELRMIHSECQYSPTNYMEDKIEEHYFNVKNHNTIKNNVKVNRYIYSRYLFAVINNFWE